MKKISIGILATPEMSKDIADQLEDELPSILNKYISEAIDWEIETKIDSITSVAEDSEKLLEGITERQESMNWDFTISLTDIPFFYNGEILLGRVNTDHNIVFLSLPAFGWSPEQRIKKMVLQVIEDMYYKDSDYQKRERDQRLNNIFLIDNIDKEKQKEKHEIVIRYLISSRFMGTLTLLSGMTYDNKPWRLMPALKSVLAIAFASGAYGMIFPTLWQLSYEYSSPRLISLTLLSVAILIMWIIQAHNLWETKDVSKDNVYRKLYNTATISTLLVAIILFYLVLFVLYLITSFFLVEPQFFMEQVNMSDAPTLLNYLQLAWMTSSVGIISGAIGVGLEDEDVVRKATYGYRQRQRYDKIQERREEEGKEANADDD